MARARSPNSIEAEEMYKNGMKLVDIAKKLDVRTAQFGGGNQHRIGTERQKERKTNARKRKKRTLAIKVDSLETEMQLEIREVH